MTRRGVAAALLSVAALAALIAVTRRPILDAVGGALHTEDRLERADAIAVLAGDAPSRAARAAGLFREGWAPAVIISRPETTSGVRALVALGVRPLDLQGESRMVLEKLGVPASRIVALSEPAKITEAELAGLHAFARERGYRRVILVTSPQHTRRVKIIWGRQTREDRLEGLVVSAPAEDFSLDGWWRKRRVAEAVVHEYLGIAALYLGLSPHLR
jgi:uncharacterized SAM-binding protein YcdF (DUF218 family)